MLAGEIKRAMIVGKGSLFLARMTNLFDGISFIIEQNGGKEETSAISKEEVRSLIAESMRKLGESLVGSEE
jgi:betaine reductase